MSRVDAPREKGADKVARIPVRVEAVPGAPARKPAWIRVKAPSGPEVRRVRALLRRQRLHTVCEEAACPNLGECFSLGTATFLVMGDVCTRRCPFCDVAHGRPEPLDPEEPAHLAETVALLGLRHAVVTSVDRDDLRDGGAAHFAACIRAIRTASPGTRVEVLVPDFRGRLELALETLAEAPPDVFNHNLETVPRLYRAVRPGADYGHSLELLRRFGAAHPAVPTKSGLMLGLGETRAEVDAVLQDLRARGVTLLTLGQYLQPTRHHLPVTRYLEPAEFAELGELARGLGFRNAASGPLVRSSYHAEEQAGGRRP
ncbi:MAG: lipoyl synthase [Gammaproteobacteria bacterium]|nr:lipoyl synthase [Gammaproteobacteria bacterium]